MARPITEERRVLMRSLHTIPEIHRLFKLHKCEWMARHPGTYSEEIVQEFYASYTTSLRGSIDKRSKPTSQDPLTSPMVRDGALPGVVPSRVMPNKDLSSLRAELDRLWANLDAIMVTPTTEPESTPNVFADDRVLAALLSGDAEDQFDPTHARELCQQRMRESVVGASTSTPIVEVPTVVRDDVSISEGAVIADVGTTEGDPSVVPAGSRNPDPPAR
uniref:Integrase core domain containing protein n=1 Tax=Solanum tuberosum TaxID=4113 RepID=M1DLI6_SOLTU